jgi:hypothetical protein
VAALIHAASAVCIRALDIARHAIRLSRNARGISP